MKSARFKKVYVDIRATTVGTLATSNVLRLRPFDSNFEPSVKRKYESVSNFFEEPHGSETIIFKNGRVSLIFNIY